MMNFLLPSSDSASKELEIVKLVFMQFTPTLQPTITQRKLPFIQEGSLFSCSLGLLWFSPEAIQMSII